MSNVSIPDGEQDGRACRTNTTPYNQEYGENELVGWRVSPAAAQRVHVQQNAMVRYSVQAWTSREY